MSFKAYWERRCQSTPQLRNEENKMTMTVAAFRVAQERAYQAGVDDLSEAADAFGKIKRRNPITDIFDDIFGGLR